MEDRYLCRAKRKSWREFPKEMWWVEGYYAYFKGNDNHCIYYETDELTLVCDIDISTLCACTGLKDKSANLIWENDVVKQFADCNELGNSLYFFYQIRWNNEYSAFEGYEIYTEETVLFPDLEDIEVIGNIFDNPELLESEG